MEALQHARGLFLYPLAIAIYLLRDVLVVLFFNFGHGGRRGDATAFIILFLAYFPLTGILVSLEMVSLIPDTGALSLGAAADQLRRRAGRMRRFGLAGLSPPGAGRPLRPRHRLRPAAGDPRKEIPMPSYDYDLFVIGAGSGGVRAARVSAGYGARVAIAEEYRVGGTCVIRGCVPKKLLVYAAHVREEIEDAAGYGWTIPEARFDWASLIANKDREIDRLESIYRRVLDNAKVTLIEGRARFADAHTVVIGNKRITADKILIATGGYPVRLPGFDEQNSITSNEAFYLEKLPERIAIVGGGYIAVEFAGIFNGLGSEVSLLYRGEQILRGFDDDLRHGLAMELTRKGIDVRLRAVVHRIEPTVTGWRLHFGRRRHPGGGQGHGRHRPSPEYRGARCRAGGGRARPSRRRRRRCLFARRARRTSTPSAM